MRWQDIGKDKHGDDIWTIPEELSKNGRKNQVPLCNTAIEILEKVRNLGQTHLGKTKNDNFKESIVLYPFYSKNGSHIGELQKASKQLNKLCNFEERFTPHDLRRTVATNLQALGINPEIRAKILNHKSSRENAGYVYLL